MIPVFLPWWGDNPGWERQFLAHVSALKTLTPVLVGDAAKWCPEFDVPRVCCTPDECEARASEVAGVTVHKADPRIPRGQAVAELKPVLADMYPEMIAGCEWWGYGDWDVVWGDWDDFIEQHDLTRWDVISTNAATINGPLTLYRNRPDIVTLYRQRLDWLADPATHWLDEPGMDQIVREAGLSCWYLVDANAHDCHPVWNRCRLQGKKLYRMDQAGNTGGEVLKFHFPRGNRWPL